MIKREGNKSFARSGGIYPPDPPRHIVQTQRADAMDAKRVLHGEAPQGFGDDALAFLHREFLECFVFEARDFLAFVMIPHPTLEADIAAGAKIEQLAACQRGIDGGLSKAKTHQPPATGGMKTTASPWLKGRDQSLNSLLTATFSCSRDSVNP